MSGDLSYPNVALLLHGNGAEGAKVAGDTSPSPKTVSYFGNARTRTTQGKFNGSSLYFDGASYLGVPTANGAFNLSAVAYAMECWFWLEADSVADGAGGKRAALFGIGTSGVTGGFNLMIDGDASTTGTGLLAEWTNSAGVQESRSAVATISKGAWHHVAVVGTPTGTYIALDGTVIGTGAARVNNLDMTAAANLWIGRCTNFTPWDRPFKGYIAEVRITKAARYAPSSFASPTAPFPDWAGQVAGIVRDEAGAVASRTVRAYRRDTGALQGSAVSDAGTGAYTINVPTLDECSVLCLDDAAGSVLNDIVRRVTPN